MKKLLTTLFMAVLAVSAFADITVQTITPTVYHEGTCERAGTIKFVVDNDQDYQQIDSDTFVLIRVELTDNAVLCHDLDGIDGDTNDWIDLEVDGVFWSAGEVQARGARGDRIIYIKICDNPWDDLNTAPPSPAAQGWFIVGNTNAVGDMAVAYDPNAICVNYSNTPEFPANDFHLVSITDWEVQLDDVNDGQNTGNFTCGTSNATTGQFLGTSYDPANPAIAYGGPESPANFTVDSSCAKYGSLDTPDVPRCMCYTATGQVGELVYECNDLYRVGTLDLYEVDECEVWIEENAPGMLPVNSVLTMTVVDAQGNPLSTVDNGVYIADMAGPSLYVRNSVTSELTLAANAGLGGEIHDSNATGEYSDWYVAGPTDEDCSTLDPCVDLFNLYESFEWSVTSESETEAAQIRFSDINLARFTADGPICAYIRISWAPYPCGAGGDVTLWNYPICFVDCPDPADVPDYWHTEYCYYTYFPAADPMPGWWQGLAVTNVTLFYEMFDDYNAQSSNLAVFPMVDQDLDLTLYFIERDGDMYMLEGETLPAGGIATYLVMDQAGTLYVAPEQIGAKAAADAAFGDERYWVIAQADATIPNTVFAIDGFGMLGNGDEAQGFLPRANFQPNWYLWNIYNKKYFKINLSKYQPKHQFNK